MKFSKFFQISAISTIAAFSLAPKVNAQSVLDNQVIMPQQPSTAIEINAATMSSTSNSYTSLDVKGMPVGITTNSSMNANALQIKSQRDLSSVRVEKTSTPANGSIPASEMLDIKLTGTVPTTQMP